jgi:hypothetical protein
MSEPPNLDDLSGMRERIHDLDVEVARLQEQKKASDVALDLARHALEHAQQNSNEWRQENIDQRALTLSKNEANGLFATEASERRALESRIVVLERDSSSVWLRALVVAGLVLGAVATVLHFWK